MAPERPVAEEDGGGALRRKSVLVEVGRHRRDPVDGEVEIGDGVAELAHERGDEATDAGIDVEPQTMLAGERGEILDGVDDAVRELRCGAGQHDRVGIDRLRHGSHVGAEVAAYRHPAYAHVQKVAGLVERGVGAIRGDHHRIAHLRTERAGTVARRLHCHEDALGPSGGDAAASLAPCIQQTERPRDDVFLEPFQARECTRAERVLREVEARCVPGHLQHVFAAEMGVDPEPAAAPVDIAFARRFQLAEQRVTRGRTGWKSMAHCRLLGPSLRRPRGCAATGRDAIRYPARRRHSPR